MKFQWLLVFGCLLMVACSGPSETEKPSEDTTVEKTVDVAAEFKTMSDQYDNAMKEYRLAYRLAKTDEEKEKLYKEKYPNPEDYSGDFLELAKAHPDDPATFDVLYWVAIRDQGENKEEALDLLFANHFANSKMESLCMTIARGKPGPKVEERLQMLIDESPHEKVKGLATFSLANYLGNVPLMKQIMEDDEEAREFFGAEAKAFADAFVLDEAKLESLYQTAIDKYGSIKIGGRDLKTLAESALFELRYLSIGKVAPDIEGEDLDGTPFKLSDYRGKVVMLDFWGDW